MEYREIESWKQYIKKVLHDYLIFYSLKFGTFFIHVILKFFISTGSAYAIMTHKIVKKRITG